MTEYLKLNENDIRQILRKYDLKLSEYKFIEEGSGNTNFVVNTSENRYILTIFEIGHIRTKKLSKLLNLLEQYDFPSSGIQRSSNGNQIISIQGKAALLKLYVVGEVKEHLDENMLYQVGASIARLNIIPSPDYLPDHHAYGLETFSRVLENEINEEYENWIREKYVYLKKSIPSGLPHGLIHGDVFIDNVLFEGENFKALIDFEEACHYYLVFDLGMAIVGTCIEDSKIELPKVRSLVRGYQSIRKLERMEKETLQLFVEYAAIATSSWRFWKYNIDTPIGELSQRYLEMVGIAKAVNTVSAEKFMKEVF